MLHAFYNLEYVGDVVLFRLNDKQTTSYKKYDDLVVLYKDEEIIGFNVFHASNYFDITERGLITLNQSIVDSLNLLLLKYKMDKIEVDLKDKFIVGFVKEKQAHPDSDHLNVCQVELNDGITTQIVCGASNVDVNQRVVVATIGAVMKSGLMIKPSTLRKIASNGMICSAKELHLLGSENTKGILILDESYQIGESFYKQYKERGNNHAN